MFPTLRVVFWFAQISFLLVQVAHFVSFLNCSLGYFHDYVCLFWQWLPFDFCWLYTKRPFANQCCLFLDSRCEQCTSYILLLGSFLFCKAREGKLLLREFERRGSHQGRRCGDSLGFYSR